MRLRSYARKPWQAAGPINRNSILLESWDKINRNGRAAEFPYEKNMPEPERQEREPAPYGKPALRFI